MDVSVIGTGNMGAALALGLFSAGHRVTVYHRTREKALRLGARGARVAETAAAAIRDSGHTILALLDEVATREVLFGEQARNALRDRALANAAVMTSEELIALAKMSTIMAASFPTY